MNKRYITIDIDDCIAIAHVYARVAINNNAIVRHRDDGKMVSIDCVCIEETLMNDMANDVDERTQECIFVHMYLFAYRIARRMYINDASIVELCDDHIRELQKRIIDSDFV